MAVSAQAQTSTSLPNLQTATSATSDDLLLIYDYGATGTKTRHITAGNLKTFMGGGTVTSVSITTGDIFTVTGSGGTTAVSITMTPTDPGADRIVFWDDSAGKWAYLTVGSGLLLSGTTLTATGSGSGDLLAANNLSDVANVATARSNLGLAIGTNVQAYDVDHNSLAAGITGIVLGLGNGSGYQALTIGSGLSLAGTTLSASGGAGDVTKVGTPANNQVGVWTGDGTIEGGSTFTFDSATGVLTAPSIMSSGAAAGSLDLGDSDGSHFFSIRPNGTTTTSVNLQGPAAPFAGYVQWSVSGTNNWIPSQVAFGVGLLGSDGSNVPVDVDTEAELETALGGVDVVTVTTDDITSANLRTALSDESGTGAAVFAGGDIGAATATTPSSGDNDTSVATTAFVQTELGTLGNISDTAFASSWNGVTTDAATKNAVYDWGHTFDTDDDGIPNLVEVEDSSDSTSFIAMVDSATGNLTVKTDTSITYDPTAGVLSVTNITFIGTGIINGLDAIDSTTETTLEAAIDIAGDVTGTGLGSVVVASAITRDTEWDTEGEVQTAWGSVNILLETEIDASSELLALMDDETGTGLLMFNNSPTFADDFNLHATGVRFTGDGDGAFTMLGLGDGADEDLTINLDDTANNATITTSTGLTNITLTAINLTVPTAVYDATAWNGNNTVPTMDAIRDKIETLSASGMASSELSTNYFTVRGTPAAANSIIHKFPNPALSYTFKNMFDGGASGTAIFEGFISANSGTSAAQSLGSTTAVRTNHLGVIESTTGTTTTGRAAIYMGSSSANQLLLGTGGAYWEAAIYINTLSDGTETYAYRIGFGDVFSGDLTDGLYFEYDSTASANWQVKTAAAGSRSTVVTTTTVATGWVYLRAEIVRGGAEAKFYISADPWAGWTEVAASSGTYPIVSNLPTGTTHYTGWLHNIIKSAGTTARIVAIDYVVGEIRYDP
jgi:hypothetical protein